MTKTRIDFLENSFYWEQSGRVFMFDGKLYRGISTNYLKEVKDIFSSGLIDHLIKNNKVPETKISDKVFSDFELVLEHKLIEPITYPTEWSFEMLKQAALLYIEVNKIANQYGYELQDAHPYNIVFDCEKPYFVDFGSIIPIRIPDSWCAYHQFYSWFIIPLKLFAAGDFDRLAGILNNPNSDYTIYHYYQISFLSSRSIINKLIRKCLNLRNNLLLPEIKANNNATHSFHTRNKKLTKRERIKLFIRKNIFCISKIDLNKIEDSIRKISCNNNTDWGGYHNELFFKDGQIVISERFKKIAELISSLNINKCCEIAANQGVFTEYLLDNGIIKKGIAIDYDYNAIDQLYSRVKERKLNVTPVLANPFFPFLNYFNRSFQKRLSGEIVIALAVTHHLILTQKMSIDFILKSLLKFTTNFICIEFMPLGLYHKGYAPALPSWYNKEWFESELKKYCTIMYCEQLEENRIVYIGKKNQ